MNEKKKVQKYMTLYMSVGMCFGVSCGLVYGMLLFPDNMALGICVGIPNGVTLVMAVGAAKAKRRSEKMREFIRMEDVPDSSDKLIYVRDKNGAEKEYKVAEKKMKEEKFSVGDRIAEETDGSLVSLEMKNKQ